MLVADKSRKPKQQAERTGAVLSQTFVLMHDMGGLRAADYGLTPRDRPKLFVLCAEAPRAALLEREAALVGTLANAEQVSARAIMHLCVERFACRVPHTLGLRSAALLEREAAPVGTLANAGPVPARAIEVFACCA